MGLWTGVIRCIPLGEELGDGLLRSRLRWLPLIRKLPLADRLALTALLGVASRNLLHLPGSARQGFEGLSMD